MVYVDLRLEMILATEAVDATVNHPLLPTLDTIAFMVMASSSRQSDNRGM